MISRINILDKNTNELLTDHYSYSVDAKKALICFIMQVIKHNYNTWNYPKDIEGITESNKRKNVFYYETDDEIIQAYQI